MLSNRLEFYVCDAAAMHLGAAPFSVYNTPPPSRSSISSATPATASPSARRSTSSGSALPPRCSAVAHIVCVDGAPDGTVALERLEAAIPATSTSRRRGNGWSRPTCSP